MKRTLLCLILAIAMVSCQLLPAFAKEYEPSFWAKDAVEEGIRLSIFSDYISQKSFQSPMSRQDFINLAVNLYATITAEDVSTNAKQPFSDTVSDFPNMAYYIGFVEGDGTGLFRPLDNLTRQELCKIITALLDCAGVLGPYFPSENVFDGVVDQNQIADWARNHVAFMLDNTLMTGDEDGEFRPLDPVTREEAAIIIHRCFQKFGPQINGQITTYQRTTKDANGNDIQSLMKLVTLPNGATVSLEYALTHDMSDSDINNADNGLAPSGTPLASKGDNNLYPLKTYSMTLRTGEADEKELRIFGENGRYTSAEEAEAHMSEVTVDVWKINEAGAYYSSTLTFKVNTILKDDVIAIFDEIYNAPVKAPLKDVTAYAWRSAPSSGTYSDHNYGTAIDLNYNENYCLYADGSQLGSFHDPETSVYSFDEDGIVVQTFAKYGWLWGGNAWVSGTTDFMHFTYLGK